MTTTTSIFGKIGDSAALSERAKTILADMTQWLIYPLIGFLVFLLLWSVAAQNIDTSLGKFPGPAAVWQQFGSL